MARLLPNSCSGVTAERTLVKPSIKGRTVPGEGGHRFLRQMWLITNLLCRVTQCSKVSSRACLYVCSQMPASGCVFLFVYSDVMDCLLPSVISDVCLPVCVLSRVYLNVFFCRCSSVYARIWLFSHLYCVLLGGRCILLLNVRACVQHRDICVLDAALLPALVRGSSHG